MSRPQLPPASFWDWDDAIRYARASSHVHRRRMRVTGGALGAWTVRMA